MNAEAFDIEVYAKIDSGNAVILLLSQSLGPLQQSCAHEDVGLTFHSGSITVILQPSEDGFLSIWVRNSSVWSSCPALGRHLAKELGCIVRCDPGHEFPEINPRSSVFLEIEAGNERLLHWD
ncbi:hypothetical protein ACFONG_16200 [Uliginosibacterium paludis]|uniref:Integron gene cassette protein n=1 Tax=Uliginosibacterium paludis TaxID=1615952 RepID=A0ABV2CUD5_9RHOO